MKAVVVVVSISVNPESEFRISSLVSSLNGNMQEKHDFKLDFWCSAVAQENLYDTEKDPNAFIDLRSQKVARTHTTSINIRLSHLPTCTRTNLDLPSHFQVSFVSSDTNCQNLEIEISALNLSSFNIGFVTC